MSLENDTKNKNVLFIPSGSIGDALMMISLCGEIMTLDPTVSCTIVARRNADLITDLSAAYPGITVIKIGKNLRGIVLLLWSALKRPYVVLMPAVFGNGVILNTKNLFFLLAHRPGTITSGLLRDAEPNPYSTAVSYDNSQLHFTNMRRMARAAGLSVLSDSAPIATLRISPQESPIKIPSDPYFIVHPFGSSSWKSFPPRRVRELLEWIVETYSDVSVIVTGGKENEEEALSFMQGIPRTYLAVGRPIREVASLIRNARLYVGVDTGTTHLACLLHQKSIVLEHNASPEWLPTYNPYATILKNDEHCLCKGRKNNDCKIEEDGRFYHRCLYEITDTALREAIQITYLQVVV